MSVKHQKRIEGIVDGALKEAALNEPYGFVVTFTFAPPTDEQGTPQMGQPHVPSWWVFVSIRNPNVGHPDIGNGFAINGVLPPDDAFRFIATGLLAKCRLDRDKDQQGGLAEAQAAFRAQMNAGK